MRLIAAEERILRLDLWVPEPVVDPRDRVTFPLLALNQDELTRLALQDLYPGFVLSGPLGHLSADLVVIQ